MTFLLAIPVVLGLAYACRWAAERERDLANALLDADVERSARRALQGGPMARIRNWLSDPVAWREQAYLVLRFLVGLPFGVLALSLAGTSLGLAVAPTWYWTQDEVLDYGVWKIDTLGEAFAVVPIGLAGLVLAAHLVRVLAAAFRGMARGMLGSGGAAAAPSAPVASAERPRRRTRGHRAGLIWHGAVSGLVALMMTVIWAATTHGGYFWPVWVMLPLTLAFTIHAAVEYGALQPVSRRALSIHAGVTGWVSLFFIGIWAASTRGYFWPVWAIGPLMLAVGVHAVWAYMRRGERIEQLTTTRAGAVDAQAAELRRIERDLHDGAQARLVALSMDLGMAEEKFAHEPEAARRLMGEAREEARRALVELRDLARGIHPPVLTDRGLEAAVAALAARSPVPVTVRAEAPERLAAAVESAAYFTVAEALTNAAKHSGATRIDIRLAWLAGELVVEG